jgi:hypothetical protein
MSAVETPTEVGAQSSVEIAMNSKGEAQVKVKCYVGIDAATIEDARTVAKAIYYDTIVDLEDAGLKVAGS